MSKLDGILKSRDITLSAKVHLVKVYSMYTHIHKFYKILFYLLKNTVLSFFDLSVIVLVSILFISVLIFVISFPLITFGIVSCFCSSLRYKVSYLRSFFFLDIDVYKVLF